MRTACFTITILVAFALLGCQPTAENCAAKFHALQTGVDVTEVDRQFGPSAEISRNQLPKSFRAVYPEVEGVTYRRWTYGSGDASATLYAGVRNDQLTSERLVEQIETKTGFGTPP